MQRCFALLAAVIMVGYLCACGSGNAGGKTDEKSLYEHGLDVIEVMTEMTQLESYVEMCTGSGEIKEAVKRIGVGDYTAPKTVYAITAGTGQIAAYAEVDELEGASEELRKVMDNKFIVALTTQINGFAGVEQLAAASVCTAGKTFVSNEISESVIYLYTYENARPVCVTFTCGEDSTVSASGMFIMYDGFPCGSAVEIETFFSEVGVTVSEVQK